MQLNDEIPLGEGWILVYEEKKYNSVNYYSIKHSNCPGNRPANTWLINAVRIKKCVFCSSDIPVKALGILSIIYFGQKLKKEGAK